MKESGGEPALPIRAQTGATDAFHSRRGALRCCHVLNTVTIEIETEVIVC